MVFHLLLAAKREAPRGKPVASSTFCAKPPQLKPLTLDFGSSGQGKHPVWQPFADGIELINALELVDWESEETQFLVCEGCGQTGCKSGNWVSVRKSDSLVFILPASNYVWGDKKDKEVPHIARKRACKRTPFRCVSQSCSTCDSIGIHVVSDENLAALREQLYSFAELALDIRDRIQLYTLRVLSSRSPAPTKIQT